MCIRKPGVGGFTMLLWVALIGVLGLVSTARAESCPNEAVRAQEPYGATLPDCRAYEQVSPVDKNGAEALGGAGYVQSSPSGEGVTYFSFLPFPDVAGAADFPSYVSMRGGESWSTQGLLPLTGEAGGAEELAEVVESSEDLAYTVVGIVDPAAETSSYYLRDNHTGTDQLLFSNPSGAGVAFAAMSSTPPGTPPRLLFTDQTSTEIVPGVLDTNEEPYLYEWEAGQLSLVAAEAEPGAGDGHGFFTQHTLSEDGSRAFFTNRETGEIFVREDPTGPDARTAAVSAGSATYLLAPADGKYVFYLEGGSLYRFDVDADSRELVGGSTEVIGSLGASEDGSSIYFASSAVLAGEDAEHRLPKSGEPNVYAWHEDSPLAFVATLRGRGGNANFEDSEDHTDWITVDGLEQGLFKSARVDPGGETLLFSSTMSLTGYDNVPASGKCASTLPGVAFSQLGCEELYLYEAGPQRLWCVSCNPAGTPATDDAYLTIHAEGDAPAGQRAFLTRNLSANGDRVFFETGEALVRGDTNGVGDTYEWEREGSSECDSDSSAFVAREHGCVYLISGGHSSSPSFLGEASANGSDVFFFTRQPLVGQDVDEDSDVYDAREDGGIATQSPPAPVLCAEETCRPQAVVAPVFGAPATATLLGSGNLPAPAATVPAVKAKAPTRAQELAKALSKCRSKANKQQRKSCEAAARKRYGPVKAKQKQRAPAKKARKANRVTRRQES